MWFWILVGAAVVGSLLGNSFLDVLLVAAAMWAAYGVGRRSRGE